MIGRLLKGALIIVGAIVFSQVPEFAQQYRQRIGGAVDELNTFVTRFDADAKSQGLTRNEALSRHLVSTDDLFKKRGVAMQDTIDRLDRLSVQQRAMTDPSSFVRLVNFATYADAELARNTFNAYEPAVPVTTEGGVMALIGAFFGWLIARLFGAPKRMLDRRLADRREEYRV
jgi:hypothetical protein